jgi:hypothetical protein
VVDKQTKRKLRRIWCERLVIGLCLPVALGFSVVKVRSVCDLIGQQQAQNEPQIVKSTVPLAGMQNELQAKQKLQQESLLLGISALCFIVMLILAQRQRNRISEAVDGETKHKLKRIRCERLVISLCLPVALGFSVVKAQLVYDLVGQQQAQNKPQIPKTYLSPLEQQVVAEMNKLRTNPKAYISVLESYRQRFQGKRVKVSNQFFIQTHEGPKAVDEASAFLKSLEPVEDKKAVLHNLQQELLLLGISVASFIVMMLLLLRQRNRISLTLTGQLICFFPEECIAELEALHEKMKSEQRSNWLIHMIMLQNFLGLLWAFYVQINIENLWLPQHRGHKNIDAQNSYMDSVDDEEYKRYIWAMIRTRKFQ